MNDLKSVYFSPKNCKAFIIMALLSEEVIIDFSSFPDECMSGLTSEEVDNYIKEAENENIMEEIDATIQTAHSELDIISTAQQTKFYLRKFKDFLKTKDYQNSLKA